MGAIKNCRFPFGPVRLFCPRESNAFATGLAPVLRSEKGIL